MTRKYLGISQSHTFNWLKFCRNCSNCRVSSIRGSDIDWEDLKEHISVVHVSHELCLGCYYWVEDEDFAEHLLVAHGVEWQPS